MKQKHCKNNTFLNRFHSKSVLVKQFTSKPKQGTKTSVKRWGHNVLKKGTKSIDSEIFFSSNPQQTKTLLRNQRLSELRELLIPKYSGLGNEIHISLQQEKERLDIDYFDTTSYRTTERKSTNGTFRFYVHSIEKDSQRFTKIYKYVQGVELRRGRDDTVRNFSEKDAEMQGSGISLNLHGKTLKCTRNKGLC